MCCRTHDAEHTHTHTVTGSPRRHSGNKHRGVPQRRTQISGRTRSWQNVICDMIKNVAERGQEGGSVDSESLRQEAGAWGSFLLCVVFARGWRRQE